MTRLPLLALLLLASDTDGINNAIVASPRSAEGPALSAVDEAARMLPLELGIDSASWRSVELYPVTVGLIGKRVPVTGFRQPVAQAAPCNSCNSTGKATIALVASLQRWAAYSFCVTPYLVASTSPQGTHPARLFVFGDCRWLQPFVRLLPPIASVTMVSADSDWTYGPVLLGVAAPTALVMLVADTPEQLVASSKRLTALPELTRMLFWTAAFDYREFAAAANRLWALCVREALIATTFPDGVSRVFALDNFRCGLQGASVDELDVWPMAGTGWERSAVVADALFRPPCSAWRPLPPGEVPALIHFREDTSPCIKKIAVWLQDANARLIAVLSRTLPFQAVVECPERGQTAFMRAADCRLGAFFNSRPLPVFLFMHQALATFPWEMSALVVAVPARAGPRRGLLHPLTSEFSGDVWMATAAVLLAQWAALLALLPVDRDQATTGPRAPGSKRLNCAPKNNLLPRDKFSNF
ncbi:hypothetical protein ONE63_010358 [Megalurothrips usitatus]|uniref:Uncharacterized protein n=1 Tax=Megalurothrips usitatus TaxID=439358 RepID=A0AAV7XII3_9NEOP|nr:hypothetical protein ONE63_010358 [Megalurothrips usitatus]